MLPGVYEAYKKDHSLYYRSSITCRGKHISLGSYETEMPNVVGLGKDEAIFALMKAGFLYDNISVIEKYDTTAKPSSVISVTPAAGEPVNPDSYVVITYNSYSETE